MTRDEFEDWLDERKSDALDDAPQGETSAQKWLSRLYVALKSVADEEDAPSEEEEAEDSLYEDSEDETAEDEEEEEDEA